MSQADSKGFCPKLTVTIKRGLKQQPRRHMYAGVICLVFRWKCVLLNKWRVESRSEPGGI